LDAAGHLVQVETNLAPGRQTRFITQAITDGMTTLDVARLCGTSVGMIEKHYGHLVADAARERLAAVRML